MGCVYCGADGFDWLHELDRSRARYFDSDGSSMVWGSPAQVCDRCETLFIAGVDEALVALYVQAEDVEPDLIEADARIPLRALRSAYLSSASLNDTLPAGASAWRAQGFTPIEQLTGDQSVVLVWPDADKQSVPETRPDELDDAIEGRFWLVRSPWPGIDIQDVMGLFWDHFDGGMSWGGPDQAERAATLFNLSRDEASTRLSAD